MALAGNGREARPWETAEWFPDPESLAGWKCAEYFTLIAYARGKLLEAIMALRKDPDGPAVCQTSERLGDGSWRFRMRLEQLVYVYRYIHWQKAVRLGRVKVTAPPPEEDELPEDEL